MRHINVIVVQAITRISDVGPNELEGIKKCIKFTMLLEFYIRFNSMFIFWLVINWKSNRISVVINI
jgi:hypothetical protein